MKCYTSSFISFVWQRYGKRHEKALGKARKSGAEGVKLLKESGAIFFVHNLFVFYFIFLNRANSSTRGSVSTKANDCPNERVYNLFFSSFPAPVPLYLLRVALKLYVSDAPMFCV